MYQKRNRKQPIRTCVSVTADECGGNPEKMIRRFTKKVKKEGIMEECRKRSHFIKPTTERSERKRAKKRLIQKVNKKREELFSLKNPFKRRR
jgi:small subunit ribosomal protein S21